MEKRTKIKEGSSGITLIALVITIIVLLILAAVSIATLTGGNGILTKTQSAKVENAKSQAEEEVKIAVGSLLAEETTKQLTQEEKRQLLEDELKQQQENSTVSVIETGFLVKHKGYAITIDSNYNLKESFNVEEWDKTASPENIFIWGSDNPNDEGYGAIVGYTSNIQTYTTLKFPSRCTSISIDNSYIEGGTEQGQQTRSYAKNIKRVELPATVVKIDALALANDSVTGYTFEKLEEIEIPNSVEIIGSNAFEDTPWYNNQQDGLIYAGKVAYKYKGTMPSNTSIELKEDTIGIAGGAFYNCTSLTSITIPNTLTNIGSGAFEACTGLTSIVIPDSVKSIGIGAFRYWKSTQTINCRVSSEPEGWDSRWDVSHVSMSGEVKISAKIVWGYTGE